MLRAAHWLPGAVRAFRTRATARAAQREYDREMRHAYQPPDALLQGGHPEKKRARGKRTKLRTVSDAVDRAGSVWEGVERAAEDEVDEVRADEPFLADEAGVPSAPPDALADAWADTFAEGDADVNYGEESAGGEEAATQRIRREVDAAVPNERGPPAAPNDTQPLAKSADARDAREAQRGVHASDARGVHASDAPNAATHSAAALDPHAHIDALASVDAPLDDVPFSVHDVADIPAAPGADWDAHAAEPPAALLDALADTSEPDWADTIPDEVLALFLAEARGDLGAPSAALEASVAARHTPPAALVAAPRTAPLRGVHDVYDWRTIATSQQTTPSFFPRWDARQWVWVRKWPTLSLLLRSAHAAVHAVLGALRTPSFHAAMAIAARRYQNHWRAVLALEREHAEAELAEVRKRPVQELVALGIALDGMQAYWQSERHYGRRVGVFKLPGSKRLPRHKLMPGSVVTMHPVDAQPGWYKPKADQQSQAFSMLDRLVAPLPTKTDPHAIPVISGELVDGNATRVRIRISEAYEHVDLAAYDWRLDRGENDVVNERTEKALDALMYDPDDVARASTSRRMYALSGTPLRDVLLPLPPPLRQTPAEGLFARDARIRSWYERHSRPRPLAMDGDPDLGLNASQTRAVATMLKEPLSLVQGPPGTGKTRTLVKAVALLKQHFQVPHPILLAAHTNVAVDNLAAGCRKHGLKIVRAGSSAAVHPSLADETLEAHTAKHPKYAQLLDEQAELKRLQLERGALDAELAERRRTHAATGTSDPRMGVLRTALGNLRRKIGRVVAKSHVLRSEITASVLHGADVVCATAISAGSRQLDMIDFPIVFVDEGSMATEPIALIPLMKGCAQLALIGDHKQLPPVLRSIDAKRGGLSTSLFERLMHQGTPEAATPDAQRRPRVPSVLLDEQFRMHPTLAAFPNAAFYRGALRDAPSTSARTPLASAYAATRPDGTPSPVTLVAHGPVAASTASAGGVLSSVSPYNVPQADLALALLCDLLVRNPTLRGDEIGIVTPYEAQVRLLQRMLAAGAPAHAVLPGEESLPHLSEHAVHTLAAADPQRAAELAAIEVHTVDGFEGREKPVMLFSTVKSGGGALRGTAALHAALASPSWASVAALADLPTQRGGYVGFLADTRRLNVALTRAQCQLFLLGNLDTLLSARLGSSGEQAVEHSDVHAIRKYARWLLAQNYVLDVDVIHERLLEEAVHSIQL